MITTDLCLLNSLNFNEFPIIVLTTYIFIYLVLMKLHVHHSETWPLCDQQCIAVHTVPHLVTNIFDWLDSAAGIARASLYSYGTLQKIIIILYPPSEKHSLFPNPWRVGDCSANPIPAFSAKICVGSECDANDWFWCWLGAQLCNAWRTSRRSSILRVASSIVYLVPVVWHQPWVGNAHRSVGEAAAVSCCDAVILNLLNQTHFPLKGIVFINIDYCSCCLLPVIIILQFLR